MAPEAEQTQISPDDLPRESSVELPVLQVVMAAPAALAWLERGRPSRVLHVFRLTCNVIDEAGDVLSLTLDPEQMDPLSIALEKPGEWGDFVQYIDAESEVSAATGKIAIGPLEIQVEDPVPWPSRPDWGGVRAALSGSPAWLKRIETRLIRRSAPDSLAAMLGEQQVDAPGEANPGWWTSAAGAVQALLESLRGRDPRQLQQGAAQLAGLGVGLTPSGDDFLIGSMHALWSTLDETEASRASTILAEAASERTAAFSSAHLRATASGEAAAPWQRLLGAIMRGEPSEIDGAVDALLLLGHTSGQDALAGFLLGMKSLAQT